VFASHQRTLRVLFSPEEPLRCGLAVAESLVARGSATQADEHHRAIAQHNLGDWLLKQKRFAYAEPLLAAAVANFEKLKAKAPESIALESHCGMALATLAKLFEATDRLAEAKNALASAIGHQRNAIRLSRNVFAYRVLLDEHIAELVKVDLKLGAYDDAAMVALDVPKTSPGSRRAQACLEAARILARVIMVAVNDTKLAADERERLTHKYVGRTILVLGEAIDTSPSLSKEIKSDPDIKQLESQPEFKTLWKMMID
jgi:tetratricopeptide (TPR) repeat protein